MTGPDDRILNWTAPAAASALGPMPVHVQRADGEIVASGLSGQDIAVPPGEFYLSVTLPNGREITGAQVVDLRDGPAPALPSLAAEIARSIDLAHFTPTPVTVPPAPDRAVAAGLWSGDWVAGWGDEAAPARPDLAAATPLSLCDAPREIGRGAGADTVLLLPAGEGTRAFVMPGDGRITGDPSPLRIIGRISQNGTNVLFSSPVSSEVNALIEYVEAGLMSESQQLALGLLREFDDASMLRTLVAAFVLLRVNDVEATTICADRLGELFEVPDAVVLTAEAYARAGRHASAVAALRIACAMPCPWFRSGVSFLLERLKYYLATDRDPNDFALDPRDRAVFERHRPPLARMAAAMDYQRPFTTFILPPA